MKLALFTNQFPGQVNTFLARDVRGLLDAGIEVEIFAIYPLDQRLWPMVPDTLSDRVLPRSRVHHLSLIAGLRGAAAWPRAWHRTSDVASVVAAAVPYGLSAMAKSAYAMAKGVAWARQHAGRFDHVLAYWGNYAATSAYVFHRALGRDLPFSIFLHAGTDLYRSRVFLRQKLAYAQNIFVVCQFNREFLRSIYPAEFEQLAPKIHVHHLGLDLLAIPFQPAGRPPRSIVAVGGLHALKGFDDLLRAVAELARRGHGLDLTLVGGGPEERSLRQLADDLGIGERVRWTGWEPPDTVLRHIAAATLLVHPSNGLGDAVPTVIKEAMALGTPVVASSVAGIPELLDGGRCGVLVEPRRPGQLADAIAALIEDEPRRLAHATAARARAEALFCQAKNGAALAERLRRTAGMPLGGPSPALVNAQ